MRRSPIPLFLAVALLLTSCSRRPAPPPAPQAPTPAPAPAPAPAPPPPPQPQLLLSATEATQGEMLVLRLTGLAPAGAASGGTGAAGAARAAVPKLAGWDDPRPLVPLNGDWVALLPVYYAAKPGPRDLVVTLGSQRWTARVTITQGNFPESRVYVSEEKGNLLTDPQAEKDSQRIEALKAKTTPTPLWQGRFIWPVRGNITTQFGMIRYVNDKVEGRHSGLDIAAPEGTLVRAPAAGKVVLADKLVVTGYTVILDHGLGLFTSYSHMQSFNVKVGQSVAAGEVIGRVGETGLATGPHLHWTVSIGSTPTDPLPWLKEDPLAVSAAPTP